MSAPSRPHRRLSLALPTGGAPPPPRHEAPEEPAHPPRPTGLLPVSEPTSPRARAACAGPPAGSRVRLTLTQSTGAPSEGAPPELGMRRELPIGNRLLPKDAAILALTSVEADKVVERTDKPRRRLRLTLPSGLAGAQMLSGEPVVKDRVEISFFLPKPLVAALEEEWWRRQSLGEEVSRSDIARVALQAVLAQPERLTQELKQSAE